MTHAQLYQIKKFSMTRHQKVTFHKRLCPSRNKLSMTGAFSALRRCWVLIKNKSGLEGRF